MSGAQGERVVEVSRYYRATRPACRPLAQVAKILINSGFKRVRPLRGGLDAWIAAGYAAQAMPAVASTIVASTAGS